MTWVTNLPGGKNAGSEQPLQEDASDCFEVKCIMRKSSAFEAVNAFLFPPVKYVVSITLWRVGKQEDAFVERSWVLSSPIARIEAIGPQRNEGFVSRIRN